MATCKILSIDGGGIRGIIPGRILAEVEARTGKKAADLFDFIAGTSTGGILALGLVKPNLAGTGSQFSARDLVQLYEENGSTIFSRSLWHAVEALDNLDGPKYPDTGIEKVMQTYFGAVRLKEARTPVLVPAYDIERRYPFFFRSARAKQDAAFDFPMWQVARATSAAPTYFPPEQLGPPTDTATLIDGGVFANNPTLCAYIDALQTHTWDDYLVVSLGTGNADRRIPYDKAKNWGLAGWAHPLIDIFGDGVNDTTDYQMQELLQGGTQKYFRFQMDLPSANQELDDTRADTIQALNVVADKFIQQQDKLLADLCKTLRAAPDRGASALVTEAPRV